MGRQGGEGSGGYEDILSVASVHWDIRGAHLSLSHANGAH